MVQGLLAAGQSPSAWVKSGKTPLSLLQTLQASSGAQKYSAGQDSNPLLDTVEAIPAVSGRPFPVVPAGSGSAPAPWRPSISVASPAQGSSVAWGPGSALRFQAADAGTGVAPGGVRVTVDGRSVACSLDGQTVSAQPGALAAGSHVVDVTVADRAGNAASMSGWRFTVTAASAAASQTAARAAAARGSAAASISASASASGTSAGAAASGTVATGGGSAAPSAIAALASWAAPAAKALGLTKQGAGDFWVWVAGGLLAAGVVAGIIAMIVIGVVLVRRGSA